jgi:hypothetical protein
MTRNSEEIRATRGRRVAVVEGLWAFQHIDFTVSPRDQLYDLSGRLVLDDPPSRYVLRSFTVSQRDEDDLFSMAVTAEAVHQVPVERIVTQVLQAYGTEYTPDAYEQLYEGQGIRDPHALEVVARLYLRASLSGERTADAVSNWLGCSVATAGRWIAAAKDNGHLSVATTRRR